MNDRSWMLNPQAIRIAKECIQIVRQELNVKLLLSHPEFMQLLHEYVELTDSRELSEAYSRLLAFAGVGKTLKSLQAKNTKVVSLKVAGSDVPVVNEVLDEEMVTCGGKQFPRWRDGKQFTGIYRGQPRYS